EAVEGRSPSAGRALIECFEEVLRQAPPSAMLELDQRAAVPCGDPNLALGGRLRLGMRSPSHQDAAWGIPSDDLTPRKDPAVRRVLEDRSAHSALELEAGD